MSLRVLEGFDNVDTAGLSAKGWAVTGATVASAAARNGGGGLRLVGSGQNAGVSFSPVTTVYLGFALRLSAYPGTPVEFLGLFSSGATTTTGMFLYVTATGAVALHRGGEGTIGSTPIVPLNTWVYVEIKALAHNSAGEFVIRFDELEVLNLSGVDTVPTNATVDYAILRFKGGGGNIDIDDLYINDTAGSAHNTFEGECRVATLYPSGNGNSSGLTGSDGNSTDNYALVDEATAATADYVGGAVVDTQDTYVYGDLSGTLTIKALAVTSYAAKSDAGVRSYAPVVRHGGTDYAGADRSLGTTYRADPVIMEVNPATGLPWTQADVNNAEFGFRVRP